MTCAPFEKPFLGPLSVGTAFALAATLCGCAGNPFGAKVDVSSPAAAHIAELDKNLGPYPRWSQFPKGPQPTPPPAEIARRVAGLEKAQSDLLSSAAALRWTLSGSEAFAAEARAQINPELAAPAPPDETAQIEAMAKALREQATPPPKAK